MRSVFARTKAYIALLLTGLVVVALALLLGSGPVSGDKTPVRVTIPQGASARTVARVLDDSRLIRSRLVFLLTCRMSGSSGDLKPGVYQLNRAMNAAAIIKQLVAGNTVESWVTIPEGKTLREIADILEAKNLVDSATFLRLATSSGREFYSYPFVYSNNLEGYLFPDTYLVERGTSAEQVIDTMLRNFERRVLEAGRERISRFAVSRLQTRAFDAGLHKVLVVASLVEREARVPADRAKIAAVIWNRLAKGMRLEVDATVTYELGVSRANKARVYYSDLRKDSPYNTYMHAGLPPAPICNPGLASIMAAIEPAATSDLFYVARPDGSHVFSRTLAEHNAAKQAIRGGGQ